MKSILAGLLIFVSFNASASDAFRYDQRLAIDLAQAYLSASARQDPKQHVYSGGMRAIVSSAIAAHDRHMVFVAYANKSGRGGSYVELELCKERNLLTVVDVGAVDNIQAYWSDVTRITSKTYVASPAACPIEVP